MKLETAIELLKELDRGLDLSTLATHSAALHMAVEALERLQQLRSIYEASPYQPLPGESVERP